MNAWGLADIGRAPRGLGVTRGCQQGSLSCVWGIPASCTRAFPLMSRASGLWWEEFQEYLICCVPAAPSPPPAFAAGLGPRPGCQIPVPVRKLTEGQGQVRRLGS